MYQPGTGMDHLGLASVSQDRILRALSPGINVLTIHPRYWSVYVWLLTEFWDRDLPRTHAAWGRFLKPRERVFVAAVLSCPRHGIDIPEVAGKRRIGKELEEGAKGIDPAAAYLKNSRGGYPIYASAIAQLGLIILDRDTQQFRCDAPTEAGRRVGLTVKEWVAKTKYYTDHFDDPETDVPIKVVKAYADRICLCRLADGPDHPLLQDAFLHGGDAGEARARRASLRLLCDLSAQTAAEPVEPWAFRQLVYYQVDDDGRSYTPSSGELGLTARRWRLYQHREFVAWAFNRWLRNICEWGLDRGGDGAAIAFSDVLATVDQADFAALALSLGVDDPGLSPGDPLQALLDWARAESGSQVGLDDPWDIARALCEDRVLDLLRDLNTFGDETTAGILTLLALCATRLWPKEYELTYVDDWPLVRAGGARRLSVDRFISDVKAQARAGATIAEAGRWFLEYCVIRQHHRVALGKLPDDTFRLQLDAGRVRFVNETVAVEMNDSRYRALSTIAAELAWTKPMTEQKHALTSAGKRLVADGDLPAPNLHEDDG
jgi:hypothetical protein